MKRFELFLLVHLCALLFSTCFAYEPRYNPTLIEINGVAALKDVEYIREVDAVPDVPRLGVLGGGLYVCPIGILGRATNAGKKFSKIVDILIGYQFFENFTYRLEDDIVHPDTASLLPSDTTVNSAHTYWSHNIAGGLRRNVAPFVDLAIIGGAGWGTNRLERDASTGPGVRPDSAEITRRKLTTFIMPGLEFMVPFGKFAAKLGVYVRKEFHRDADLYIDETGTGYHLVNQQNLHVVASLGILVGHGKNEARHKEEAARKGAQSALSELLSAYNEFLGLVEEGKDDKAREKYEVISGLRQRRLPELQEDQYWEEDQLWRKVEEKRRALAGQEPVEESPAAAGDARGAYEALDRSSPEALNTYVVQYPSGPHSESVRQELDNLVVSYYEAAIGENTAEAYRRFLDQYPASSYCGEIEPLLKYRLAADAGDSKLLAAFLQSYPNHELAPAATQALSNAKNGWEESINGRYDNFLRLDAASVQTVNECDALASEGEKLLDDIKQGAAVYGLQDELSSNYARVGEKVAQINERKAALESAGR
jgi:hypothetical protein